MFEIKVLNLYRTKYSMKNTNIFKDFHKIIESGHNVIREPTT